MLLLLWYLELHRAITCAIIDLRCTVQSFQNLTEVLSAIPVTHRAHVRKGRQICVVGPNVQYFDSSNRRIPRLEKGALQISHRSTKHIPDFTKEEGAHPDVK